MDSENLAFAFLALMYFWLDRMKEEGSSNLKIKLELYKLQLKHINRFI